MPKYVLAIDQGTTSSRAIVFDETGAALAVAQNELTQHYPADGWVEHDAEDIWRDVQSVMREAVAKAGLRGGDIAAIGITNQRETTVVWERSTGRPIHRAIVRSEEHTSELQSLMRISYAVFCLKKKNNPIQQKKPEQQAKRQHYHKIKIVKDIPRIDKY